MTRVAVYSRGRIGPGMASPAIRSLELARALAEDFEVTLMAPRRPEGTPDGLVPAAAPAGGSALTRSLEAFDAVVAQSLPAPVMKRLARTRTRLVFDLYTPVLGESLAVEAAEEPERMQSLLFESEIHSERLALMTGNAFVCPGERQRDFWTGALGALGRVDRAAYAEDPRLLNLIDVVPFGLPEEPPRAQTPLLRAALHEIGPDDRIVLWAGGIVPWADAATVIEAVARIATRRSEVKLVFVGVDPPDGAAAPAAARARELARSLGLLDRTVFFMEGRHPYERRADYLLEADVGVAAYHESLEARLAYRARLLDYFWAELPVVTTLTDELGELVARRELGRAVAAGDVAAFATALEELLGDDRARERARTNAAAVRKELIWPRVVEPLRRLVGVPGTPVGRSMSSIRVEAEELWARRRTSWARRGARGTVARIARGRKS